MATTRKAPAKTAAKTPARTTRTAAARPAAKPVAKPAAKPEPKKAYRLLTGVDDAAFCQKVSDALKDGYELYGSPSVTFNGKNVIAAQAVVLKKKPVAKKKKK